MNSSLNNQGVCEIPFLQRVEVPTNVNSNGGYICCGEVNPNTAEFNHGSLCMASGWSPDPRQQSIQRYWKGVLHQECDRCERCLEPAATSTNSGRTVISCGRGYTPIKTTLDINGSDALNPSKYLCASTEFLLSDVGNIYFTSVGSLSEAQVTMAGGSSQCRTDECGTHCSEPFNTIITKPDTYISEFSLGATNGCGICPIGTQCSIDGRCQPSMSDININVNDDDEEPPEKKKKMPSWLMWLLIGLGVLVVAGIILIVVFVSKNKKARKAIDDAAKATTVSSVEKTSTVVKEKPPVSEDEPLDLMLL